MREFCYYSGVAMPDTYGDQGENPSYQWSGWTNPNAVNAQTGTQVQSSVITTPVVVGPSAPSNPANISAAAVVATSAASAAAQNDQYNVANNNIGYKAATQAQAVQAANAQLKYLQENSLAGYPYTNIGSPIHPFTVSEKDAIYAYDNALKFFYDQAQITGGAITPIDNATKFAAQAAIESWNLRPPVATSGKSTEVSTGYSEDNSTASGIVKQILGSGGSVSQSLMNTAKSEGYEEPINPIYPLQKTQTTISDVTPKTEISPGIYLTGNLSKLITFPEYKPTQIAPGVYTTGVLSTLNKTPGEGLQEFGTAQNNPIISGLVTAPLLAFGITAGKSISETESNVLTGIDALPLPSALKEYGKLVTGFGSGAASMLVTTAPLAAAGTELAILHPSRFIESVIPSTISTGESTLKHAGEQPSAFFGELLGMYAGGKIATTAAGYSPVRVGVAEVPTGQTVYPTATSSFVDMVFSGSPLIREAVAPYVNEFGSLNKYAYLSTGFGELKIPRVTFAFGSEVSPRVLLGRSALMDLMGTTHIEIPTEFAKYAPYEWTPEQREVLTPFIEKTAATPYESMLVTTARDLGRSEANLKYNPYQPVGTAPQADVDFITSQKIQSVLGSAGEKSIVVGSRSQVDLWGEQFFRDVTKSDVDISASIMEQGPMFKGLRGAYAGTEIEPRRSTVWDISLERQLKIPEINPVVKTESPSYKIISQFNSNKFEEFYHATESTKGIINQLRERGHLDVSRGHSEDIIYGPGGMFFAPPNEVFAEFLGGRGSLGLKTEGGLIRLIAEPTNPASVGEGIDPGKLYTDDYLQYSTEDYLKELNRRKIEATDAVLGKQAPNTVRTSWDMATADLIKNKVNLIPTFDSLYSRNDILDAFIPSSSRLHNIFGGNSYVREALLPTGARLKYLGETEIDVKVPYVGTIKRVPVITVALETDVLLKRLPAEFRVPENANFDIPAQEKRGFSFGVPGKEHTLGVHPLEYNVDVRGMPVINIAGTKTFIQTPENAILTKLSRVAGAGTKAETPAAFKYSPESGVTTVDLTGGKQINDLADIYAINRGIAKTAYSQGFYDLGKTFESRSEAIAGRVESEGKDISSIVIGDILQGVPRSPQRIGAILGVGIDIGKMPVSEEYPSTPMRERASSQENVYALSFVPIGNKGVAPEDVGYPYITNSAKQSSSALGGVSNYPESVNTQFASDYLYLTRGFYPSESRSSPRPYPIATPYPSGSNNYPSMSFDLINRDKIQVVTDRNLMSFGGRVGSKETEYIKHDEENKLLKKKRKQQPYFIFREILPVITPIEEVGGFKQGKPFFRAIGNQQILKVTPEQRDWIHSVDVDVDVRELEQTERNTSDRAANLSGMNFYRTATKQEKARTGKPILAYTPTQQEISMAQMVGFNTNKPKTNKARRNPWF